MAPAVRLTPPVEIRKERADDVSAVRALLRQAFEQNQEGDLVDALRAGGGLLVCLVATIRERPVGCITYSPVTLGAMTGAGLGPVAVVPEYQRQGIGSRLIETGNRLIQDSGYPFIVVLGHADYYPRFGFRPARPLGVISEWDVPEDVFLLLVLDRARMHGVGGVARYRPEFSIVS